MSTPSTYKRASFRGTVIKFDEADQGLSMVDRKKMQRILSMFQSGINALQDLDGGSGLLLYAITPQIVEQMNGYQALQQRVADPGPGEGFFDGNTVAPKIDLTSNRKKPAEELQTRHLDLAPAAADALLAYDWRKLRQSWSNCSLPDRWREARMACRIGSGSFGVCAPHCGERSDKHGTSDRCQARLCDLAPSRR